MVDPSVRRLRRPVAGRIAGAAGTCAEYSVCAIILCVKKRTVLTKQAQEFAETMNNAAKMQFVLIRRKLEEDGRLVSPYGEKVEGRDDLFAIRIRHGQNVRFFYCYAVGDIVWVLSGFEKKTEKTPPAEIRKALKIKKELGL